MKTKLDIDKDTLPPIIMQVENRTLGDEFSLQRGFHPFSTSMPEKEQYVTHMAMKNTKLSTGHTSSNGPFSIAMLLYFFFNDSTHINAKLREFHTFFDP